MSTNQSVKGRPLCVDCDGTLIAADLLHESLLKYLRPKPWRILQVFAWLLRGRGNMKSELAKRVTLDPAKLPYREAVLDYVRAARSLGRRVFLVTAANRDQAEAVAAHVGCFDGVYASDERLNLKGARKAKFLAERFGNGAFDYMGDAHADFAVWEIADQAIVVARSEGFLRRLSRINPRATALVSSRKTVKTWLKLIRIHQWAKNLILFVPLVTAHRIFDPHALAMSIGAFFSLSFVASATYICNDLFDLEHDRVHKRKRYRPLPAGTISIPGGVAVAIALAAAGVGLALLLPERFMILLGIYVVLTVSYSARVKRVMLADVVLLAGLYTLRLLAGHAATYIPLSVWLLAFAIFIFFSLALAKRFVEVQELYAAGKAGEKTIGRGYQAADLPAIGALGAASGVTSVLVLILYVSSPEVSTLYTKPMILMLLAPLFLYWIGRIWLLAHRSELHEDPVLYAVKDKISYLIGVAALGVIGLAALYR